MWTLLWPGDPVLALAGKALALLGPAWHELMLDGDDQARIFLSEAAMTFGSQRMGGALRRDLFFCDPRAVIFKVGLVHALDSPPGFDVGIITEKQLSAIIMD